MPNKKYILAIDQGTTSSRAVLFDTDFKIIGIEQHESRQIFPKPGWVEQDAVEIWEAQLFVMRNLINRLNINPKDILTIGITNQRETSIVWNKKTGKPIYNAIIWQDRRTAAYCEDLKQKGYLQAIYKKTGLLIDSYFSATKIKWILDEVPKARKMAENEELLFGTVDSWLIWNLSGGKKHVSDITNASRTMLFDIHKQDWDDDLLSLMNIPKSMMPKVIDSSGVFAETALGLLGDIKVPISGCAGDQQAALFGQACFKEGMVKNTYGTGCFMLMNTGKEPKFSKNGLLTTIAWKINGETTYAIEGSVFVAGAAIKWLRDGLKLFREATDTEAMAKSVPDSGGVIVVPAFAGLGAPYWNMNARGAVFGITQGVNEKHIIRATLESLAYQTKDVLEAMKTDTEINPEMIKADGGACVNNFLMQFQSDILGTQVLRPEIIESTALGAAYLAALAMEIINIDQIAENQKHDKLFSPQISTTEQNKLYSEWKRAVRAVLTWVEETES
ncbi:MAG: glycerol kinase GlpK [Bacteroidales bacterium]|nr:glycerol kinase GlpK [Bacteroidales bacterium]